MRLAGEGYTRYYEAALALYLSAATIFDGPTGKNMKKMIIAAAVGAALLSGNAMADMTWKHYREARSNPQKFESMTPLINSYFLGALSGMASVNAQMQNEKKPQIYCVPQKLSLNPNNLKDLLANDQSPIVASLSDEYPMGMVILMVMKETFPCK